MSEQSEMFAPEAVAMLSPKLLWVQTHDLHVWHTPDLVGDEEDDQGNEIKPWTCAKMSAGGPALSRCGTGDTEEEALADYAAKHGLGLWNQPRCEPPVNARHFNS